MNVRDIRSVLINKLTAVEDRGRHHIFFYIVYEGKEYSGPKLSHSWRGDLDDQQIDWIKKPLHLTKTEFYELVDCPLDRDGFYKKWIERKGLA